MVIITADDFGLHESVNEAVERAYREGVLSTTSLMVGAPACADAIERAKRLSGLRVGLHLVMADGVSVLPRSAIPDLVDANGRFSRSMFLDGLRFFFLPWVRRQLWAEIRAQFERFRATGLVLDHVNTHKHFHLHPTVLAMILKIGPEFGLKAMRLPHVSRAPFWLKPWMAYVRSRLDACGIVHNDYVVGLFESGHLDEETLLRALENLPDGVGEIYLHPAVVSGGSIAPSMLTYRHAEELAALLSPRVKALIQSRTIRVGSFSDLSEAV
ncbi:MAG: hopanoid biosynthesis-associated protein HpnK [Burkholderiaceae bacterium]|jgi:hopanoid biosynthesis associated protein HpnK